MSADLKLLRSGIAAIHNRDYAKAVEVLEAFCSQNTALKPSEYFEAQRWLIKAYQRNGQVDLAIYLCRQMTDSANIQTRAWAKSNIEWLQEESKLLKSDRDRRAAVLAINDAISTTTNMTDSLDRLHPTSENSEQSSLTVAECLESDSNIDRVVQLDLDESSD